MSPSRHHEFSSEKSDSVYNHNFLDHNQKINEEIDISGYQNDEPIVPEI